MKKLLGILTSISMVVTTSSTVISCGNDNSSKEESKTTIVGIDNQELDVNIEKILQVKVNNPKVDSVISVENSNDEIATVISSMDKDAEKKGEFNLTINTKEAGTTQVKVKYGDVDTSFSITVIKQLEYKEGKTDSDIISYLQTAEEIEITNIINDNSDEKKALQISDKKLSVSYEDTAKLTENPTEEENVTYEIDGFEGSMIYMTEPQSRSIEPFNSFTTKFNEIFKDAENFKSNYDKSDFTGSGHIVTIKGTKGANTFDLFIYKFDLSQTTSNNKTIKKSISTKIFSKKITIS
ncbi:hypothetical protein SCORR_v1c06410 [Spiroplasma corruscae]|uniref:Lipoprotein n=1 Tax=Spiroplasma corruscae TaxID=216934 RepID=A0A222EQ90_9MOLU|nr:lipoprotein [Spiroplasma corruscae]ASP28413.1 hypothetical protein SCORR_v1c06410 [Spiroplasma corruscae]